MTDNQIAKLGDLTKPATVLVEKISDAVGGVFKPYQIVRVARAEAEADQIRAASQIQVTDLHRRAMLRFLEEEAKKQLNIENITQQALPLLDDKAAPQNVTDDWITNFFDKCRIVSDSDMQVLWSKVLAREANTPGTYSKRTVSLLADLDNSDAELFMQLCSFGWVIGNLAPLVFDAQQEIYNRNRIDFNSLIHLESLGLIQSHTGLGQFTLLKLPKRIVVSYYGRSVELVFPADADNILEVGQVLLTRAGDELSRVCGSKPVEGFFDYVYDKWCSRGFVAKRETEPGAPADNPKAVP